jgi:hypothetical protein
MPDKAEKVLSLIASCHGGTLNDSRFGLRSKGEGHIALQIQEMAKLAKLKYYKGRSFPPLNRELHEQYKQGQWKLFS